MEYVQAVILMLFNALCLFLVLIQLPGLWLMCIATGLLAWQCWPDMFGVTTLIVILAMTIVGEIVETIFGMVGARYTGGSRGAGWGALVGGILGGIFGVFWIPIPLAGALLGACAGAFGGAMSIELSIGRTLTIATRSGFGAAVGRLLGTAAKFALGLAMWVIITVDAFWN